MMLDHGENQVFLLYCPDFMHIEIHIPRPMTLLLFIAAASGWGLILMGSPQSASVHPPVAQVSVPAEVVPAAPPSGVPPAVGGEEAVAELVQEPVHGHADPAMAATLAAAQSKALEARAAQSLLRDREEVIRYQLEVLKEQRQKLGATIDENLEEEFRRSTRLLLTLLQDQKKAEQFLLSTLDQVWEADGRATALGKSPLAQGATIVLTWAVDPEEGVSAKFLDAGYKNRFKFEHYGIDIPANQGTVVHAAASGTVKDVVDHGLGFNYITIEHPGGYATLYGHLSGFTVKPGQFVAAGDAIGFSGGMPGTPGAGFSTGPHLHLGLYVGGKAIDPLPYLPSLQ